MTAGGQDPGVHPAASVDEAIHARVRLGTMAILVAEGPRDFVALRRALAVSDGNLATHLRVLEEAGYVAAHKAFVGRRPRTTYSATAGGRAALAAYARTMAQLLAALPPEAP